MYANLLSSNPDINMLLKWGKVLRKKVEKDSSGIYVELALHYIDLASSAPELSSMIACWLLSALSWYHTMENNCTNDINYVYACKEMLSDCLNIAYYFSRCASPSLQLYTYRFILTLLMKSTEFFSLKYKIKNIYSLSDVSLAGECIRNILSIISLLPFLAYPICPIYDHVYIIMLTVQFTQYLITCHYEKYLVENQQIAKNCLNLILNKNGSATANKLPSFTRNENPALLTVDELLYYMLEGNAFSWLDLLLSLPEHTHVEDQNETDPEYVVLDNDNSAAMQPSAKPPTAVSGGIGSFFKRIFRFLWQNNESSWDRARKHVMNHLLHTKQIHYEQITASLYWPMIPRTKDGWYLSTKHKLILKQIEADSEINTYATVKGIKINISTVNPLPPHNLRSIHDGLLKRLPDHLREILKPLHEYKIRNNDDDEHIITFYFNDVRTIVKKYLLTRNARGELIDAEESADESDTSPEAKFARKFTKHYDEIGLYFPELLRLKELLKLATAYRLLIGIIKNKTESMTKSDFGKHIK
ncbi:unnamed protein product [Didymodactylos carnosus]|uniref:Uncharacterized protein n=1 Tax=Didymodactylos carnosus TaxID=1234261 RepID=A0A814VFU5_9BILA|nr:unnamed protein product [Didymodactylos carnosus]CAF3951871.1 unnamed protein product [Didymodactylos carnosus]